MYSKQSLTSPQNKPPTSPTMQPTKATTLFTSQAMRTGFNFNSQKKLLNSPENGPIKPEALTLENIKFSNYKPSIATFHTHNYSESPEEMKVRKKNSDLALAKHESNKPSQNKKSYEQEEKHRLNIPLGMTHQKSQVELNSKTGELQDMRNSQDLKSPPNDGQNMNRFNMAFQDIKKPANELQDMRRSPNELQDMKKQQNDMQDMRRSPNELHDMKRLPTEVIDMRRSPNEFQDMKRLTTEVNDMRRPPNPYDLQDMRRPANEFQDVKKTTKPSEEEAKAVPFFEAKMKDSSKSVHSIDNINSNKKESCSPKEEPKKRVSGTRGRITKQGSLPVEESPKNQELVVKNQDTGEVFLLNDMNETPMNQEYLEKLKKRKKEEIWQDWWSDKRRINQELLGAVKSNNILLLEKLFDENVGDKKPEINCKDEKDWSCLHFACLAGNYGMALQLIKREAEIDPQTNLKQTPLIIAAQK